MNTQFNNIRNIIEWVGVHNKLKLIYWECYDFLLSRKTKIAYNLVLIHDFCLCII